MKTLELQLITVGLDDGQQGVFVGLPLLLRDANNDCSQIENIWFSDVKQVPDNLTMDELMEIVRQQLCDGMATVQ
jgi:hypothetical protein